MMTSEQIADAKTRIEGAFPPLECKVKACDYQAKLKFKVIDKNDKIVCEKKIHDYEVNDAGRFADVISLARVEVQAKGYVLS